MMRDSIRSLQTSINDKRITTSVSAATTKQELMGNCSDFVSGRRIIQEIVQELAAPNGLIGQLQRQAALQNSHLCYLERELAIIKTEQRETVYTAIFHCRKKFRKLANYRHWVKRIPTTSVHFMALTQYQQH